MFGFAKKLVTTLETQATNYLNVSSSNPNEFNLDTRKGLRVVTVDKNSIGAKYGFESWFDFIVSINGYEVPSFLQQVTPLDSNPYSNFTSADDQQTLQQQQQQLDDSVDFTQLLNYLAQEVNVAKSDLVFTTWSAKGGIERDIIIPNHEFTSSENDQLDDISISPSVKPTSSNPEKSAKTTQNTAFKRLQLTLQLSSLSVSSYVWHVLTVQPNSPAYIAGVMPDEFIINCEGGLLATGGEDLLGRVVSSVYSKWKHQHMVNSGSVANPYYGNRHATAIPTPNDDKSPCSIVLYVYNHDYDTVRPVTIYPNELWGGKGLLGCDIGYGLLHRIPEVLGKFYKSDHDSDLDLTPGGVLFNQQSQDLAEDSLPASSENLLKPVVQAPSFGAVSTGGPSVPPPRRSTKKASNRYELPNNDLSSYFEEESAKSKQIDGDRKIDFGDTIPLPPKIKK